MRGKQRRLEADAMTFFSCFEAGGSDDASSLSQPPPHVPCDSTSIQ